MVIILFLSVNSNVANLSVYKYKLEDQMYLGQLVISLILCISL